MPNLAHSFPSRPEETALETVLKEKPLPWTACAMLMLIGSLGCYALGVVMLSAADRLTTL